MADCMEIERKFYIDEFPDCFGEPCEISMMMQGYISVSPVVRIRSKTIGDKASYKICFKSGGSLARREVEVDITKEKFEQLIPFLNTPLVQKVQKVYSLKDIGYDNLKLECNFVSRGGEDEFFYAEVEFDSIEEANSFVPPEFLKAELTKYPLTMSRYCRDSHGFIKELKDVLEKIK